ncbi:MAG: 3-phosphoserine/phosphohydroxythreonine transaminase [Phycisphaeraceae bacterium]|nr:3-phosphoserine/phosphohydroxythreonine transaminase [Phycisphaeraceae bacterium]
MSMAQTLRTNEGGSSGARSASGRMYNFSAGPGVLPEEVVRQAQEEIWDCRQSGIGILEHSHRAPTFDAILHEAVADCRAIGDIPSDYHVLFMTGGATSQNFLVPANLLGQEETADYITTGYWAERTFEHAQMFGKVREAWDGRPLAHRRVPEDAEISWSSSPVYVHMCSNNTIYGTQWRLADGSLRLPKIPPGSFLVCDMCSDIFSRPFDVRDFGVVYAGAQKNVGVAGVSLVLIRDDLLSRKPRELPLMLQYRVMARDESRHNTPPVFPIYMSGLVFKWILRQGGLGALHARNVAKAALIYDVLDSSTFYTGHAERASRSLMNVTFRTPSEKLDDLFVREAYDAGMDNLRGHRATGGMRASVYNAMPDEGCKALADFMREFERRHG